MVRGMQCFMQNDINYFAEKFKLEFNISKRYFAVDEAKAEDIMSVCYLEPTFCFPLEKLLIAGSDTGRIKKYISFIEDMYENGNEDIKGIVQWVILEYFAGFDIEIRCRFYKYLSRNLFEATKEVELYLEDIYHKYYPQLTYRLYSAKQGR